MLGGQYVTTWTGLTHFNVRCSVPIMIFVSLPTEASVAWCQPGGWTRTWPCPTPLDANCFNCRWSVCHNMLLINWFTIQALRWEHFMYVGTVCNNWNCNNTFATSLWTDGMVLLLSNCCHHCRLRTYFQAYSVWPSLYLTLELHTPLSPHLISLNSLGMRL